MLTVKSYIVFVLDDDTGSFIKMTAVNEGRDITILLDDKIAKVSVEEFCEKMKSTFFK